MYSEPNTTFKQWHDPDGDVEKEFVDHAFHEPVVQQLRVTLSQSKASICFSLDKT